MSERGSIEDSLLESIARSDIKEVCIEFSEVALDATLEDGVLKDIPVIGTLAKLASAAGSVRDRLFAKKILHFLAALDEVSERERRDQINKLASNPKERQKVGEQLLLLIDRLENMEKPELLARAFQALLEGRIDNDEYSALSHAIVTMDVAAINAFKNRSKGFSPYELKGLDYYSTQYLTAGLISLSFPEMGTRAEMPTSPSKFPTVSRNVNKIGKLFREIVLQQES